MPMTLLGFLWSGFTHWMADDRSLVIVKYPDGHYSVDWPLEGRSYGTRHLSWVRYNLDVSLHGSARRLEFLGDDLTHKPTIQDYVARFGSRNRGGGVCN